MTDPTLIFQRTQAGRDEIYQKSHGLTQSERLVLIMIDGVSSYQAVRSKVPALVNERFERAFKKLQKTELIGEVYLPLAGQTAEELEPAVVDRFLHQDPLDPVTIIMMDPDDYFDALNLDAAAPAKPALPTQKGEQPTLSVVSASAPAISPAASSLIAQIDELAAAMEQEERMGASAPLASIPVPKSAPAPIPSKPAPVPTPSKATLAPTPLKSVPAPIPSKPLSVPTPSKATSASISPKAAPALIPPSAPPLPDAMSFIQTARLYWGYWMITVGVVFLLGCLTGRLVR